MSLGWTVAFVRRPDELGDDEAFGNWDGGVLFIGTKGKLLADCYGANPRLLPLSLNEQISVKETIPRVPKAITYNGSMPVWQVMAMRRPVRLSIMPDRLPKVF